MAECWSCGAERGVARFCTTCEKIQPVSERVDLFASLALNRKMAVPRDEIERAFREVSKRVHPDRFGRSSTVERRLALQNTEKVNTAYRTLKDPQTRAEYLLSLEGMQVGDETSRTRDPGFLMEMMELSEQVDDSTDDDALEEVREGIQARHDELMARLRAYFDEGQGTREASAEALDELRYLRRLVDRIDVKLEEMD